MNQLKLAYYRSFQAVFNVGARALPWRKAIRVEGGGAIGRLPALLRLHRVHHPMVVTDPGLVKTGLAAAVAKVLRGAAFPYQLYSEVEANPSTTTAEAIVQAYWAQRCDGFIALGGGSSIDAAKAAAARVVRPGKSVAQLGGLLKVRRRIPPFIAIPTTAGTGSETTIAALVTDSATHHKYAIMDLSLIPRYAILDPLMTAGLPPALTAASGMDALTHAVEAYLCWTYNTKESLAFAEEAVAIIFKTLEVCYRQPENLKARAAMLRAAYLAGFAFTRAGVGNIHAIAHTLGGLYGTQHGLANAVILPKVLEDYGPQVYPKLARLARAAGLEGNNQQQLAQGFIAAIKAMNSRMGIPQGFDFIRSEDIPQMVAWALKESNPLYPVPVVYDAARCRKVIESLRLPADASAS